jgi:hypothetical protein
MASFLLIHLGGAGEVLRALAVASDLRQRFEGAEIDFASAVANAPVASLSANIRASLALPPAPEEFSAGGMLRRAMPFLPGKRGMLGLAAAAKEGGNAMRAAADAGREWKAAIEKVRMREYTMAIDLQGVLASALVLRAARCGDGAGFDINSAPSRAAAMMYSHSYYVNPQKDDLARFRQLASKALGDYQTGALDFQLADAPPPPQIPPSEFALLAADALSAAEAGEISAAIAKHDLAVFVARTAYGNNADEKNASPAEVVALARRAKIALGAGFALQLAAAAGAHTIALSRKGEPAPPALSGKIATTANDAAAIGQALDGAMDGVLAPAPSSPPPPTTEKKAPLRFTPSDGGNAKPGDGG